MQALFVPAAGERRKTSDGQTQKEAAVAELTEDLEGADAIFAVDYRGISSPAQPSCDGRLAEADALFNVVKNRLAKRAADAAGSDASTSRSSGRPR